MFTRLIHSSFAAILPLALMAACEAPLEPSAAPSSAIGEAEYGLDTTIQDHMILPAATMVYGVPGPLGPSANGEYGESGTYYNDAPVYTNGSYSLYRRTDGKWYVDSNAVSEDADGTLTNTMQAQDWPWSAGAWAGGAAAVRTVRVYVHGVPYSGQGSNGDYVFSGKVYKGAPVYQRVAGGYTWSLYRRADSKWYVDFNGISEAWDGTIAYSTAAMPFPWTDHDAWSNGAMVLNTKLVHVYELVYASLGSAGEYTFSGQIYNSAPVYQRVSGGYTWSLYKRATGRWHVDFNDVSEDWDGTIAYTDAAMEWPWSSTDWHNGEVIFRAASATLADVVYARYGSVGEYGFTGTIYNDAPVYQRVSGGYTWSLYKRATGRWHVDFNDVSEDWDGTIAYTDAAMDMPWSSDSWHNGELVTSQFDD